MNKLSLKFVVSVILLGTFTWFFQETIKEKLAIFHDSLGSTAFVLIALVLLCFYHFRLYTQAKTAIDKKACQIKVHHYAMVGAGVGTLGTFIALSQGLAEGAELKSAMGHALMSTIVGLGNQLFFQYLTPETIEGA
jgi:predicted signal transduction protein with EAL and GGDEF domain